MKYVANGACCISASSLFLLQNMRRADRLFQIVQLIRGRRLSTAAFLAERLEVSPNAPSTATWPTCSTRACPLKAKRGWATAWGRGSSCPPLMFSQGEANALVAAARLAQAWLDPGLAREVEGALGKILSVLPPAARLAAEAQALYAPLVGLDARHPGHAAGPARGGAKLPCGGD